MQKLDLMVTVLSLLGPKSFFRLQEAGDAHIKEFMNAEFCSLKCPYINIQLMFFWELLAIICNTGFDFHVLVTRTMNCLLLLNKYAKLAMQYMLRPPFITAKKKLDSFCHLMRQNCH